MPNGGHCKAIHCNDGITDIYRVERYKFIKSEKRATVERVNSKAQFELIVRAIKIKKRERELPSRLKKIMINAPEQTVPQTEEPEFYTNT